MKLIIDKVHQSIREKHIPGFARVQKITSPDHSGSRDAKTTEKYFATLFTSRLSF